MRKLSLLLLTVVLASQLLAQRVISGKITDENGNPVPNASVVVKGTTIGTATKTDGSFSLTLPPNAKQLDISYVGMVTQTVNITSSSSYPISMISEAKEIGEAVVTGLTRTTKSQFAGTVNKITTKEIQNRPVGSMDQIFQGRIPGVLALTGSGQPGNNTTIIIRGTNSIQGGSSPLYVVDGIPVEAGVFQGLNPNDFQSIDVLRDAATAAMYGSRGSAGVIVVTTKRGTSSKMKVSYSGQMGIKSRPDFAFRPMNTTEVLKAQEDYGKVVQGSANNSTSIPGWYYSKLNPRYIALTAPQQADADRILDSIRQININWSDYVFRQGSFSNHQISLSGGVGKARIYSSVALYNEEGTTARTDMTRVTLRNNVDYSDDKLTFGFSSNFGYTKRDFQQSTTTNSTANPFLIKNIQVPYALVYKPNGVDYATGVGNKFVGPNQLDLTKYDLNYNDQIKATAGFNIHYKFTKDFTAGIEAGIDFRETQATAYASKLAFLRTPAATSTLTTLAGSQQETFDRFYTDFVRPSFNFRKQWAQRHDIDLTILGEAIEENDKNFNLTGFGIDPRTPNTPAAITAGNSGNQLYITAGGGKDRTTLLSGLFLGRYSFDSKYTITGSFRRDGSSKLSPSARWQSFYSVGAIWEASKEDFIRNIRFINVLRLRGSWGSAGNSNNFPTSYLYQATYGNGAYSGLTTQVATYPGNPNAVWERTFTTNIGLDFELWKRRIYGDFNWYDKHTKDLFVRKTLTGPGFGLGSINVNAGELENEGYEWNINVDVLKKRDLVWTIFSVGSYNKNHIVSLGGEQPYPTGTSFLKIGLPLGSHYEVGWAGVDAATGQPLYYDLAGHTTTTYSTNNAVTNWGTWEAPWKGGFGTNFKYKGLEFNVLFSWERGARKYDNLEYFVENPVGFLAGQFNQSADLHFWTKPGDVASTPSPIYGTNFSSKLIHDASFLRLRDITMAYTLPATVLKSLKFVSNVRFYMQANNVYIWTHWRGMDPEAGPVNINLSEFPNPRAFTGGIDVTF